MQPDVSYLQWPIARDVEWAGQWIAVDGIAHQTNAFFRARRKWHVDDVPASCLLHISAESRYRVYVNGQPVGLGPVRGTRAINFYDTYDIAPLMARGDNWLAIAVQSPNTPTFKAAPAQPCVIAQLDDGSIVRTDDTFQVQVAREWRSDVPLYTFQIGYIEWQDRRKEPGGWTTGHDDAARWQSAGIIAGALSLAGKRLARRDIPALREASHLPVAVPVLAEVPAIEDRDDAQIGQLLHREVEQPYRGDVAPAQLLQLESRPVALPAAAEGSGTAMIFDFGRAINGGFVIDIDAPAGTIVDVAYDEELTDGRIPVVLGPYLFADRYVLSSGRQRVTNLFAERGFRVLRVVIRPVPGIEGEITLHHVSAVDRSYPFEPIGSFDSSDGTLDKLWALSLHTINACATDTFLDCPWRENAFYLNDMLVENIAALQAFGDGRFNARCFRLAATQVRGDGLIPAPVPYGIVPGFSEAASAERMTFPAANLFLPEMIETYLLYTGDEQLPREYLPILKKMLHTIGTWGDAKGLIQPPNGIWNFVDWSFDLSEAMLDGRNTAVLNWLYVKALHDTVRLAGRLGASGEVAGYQARAACLATAIDSYFWHAERNTYAEWIGNDGPSITASKLTCAIALLSGHVPRNRVDALVGNLIRDDLLTPELYLHHYLLRAMVQNDLGADAIACVRKLWGPIAQSESATLWECGVLGQGKSAWGGAGSVCHAFSATPVEFMQRVVLGVEPLSPGFGRCLFSPRPFDLTFARGTVPTPFGNLHASWQALPGVIQSELQIPAGITVQLHNGQTLGAGIHRIDLPRMRRDDLSAVAPLLTGNG